MMLTCHSLSLCPLSFFFLCMKGWTDYVLWAPFGNEGMGYETFVCVESGCVSKPVPVAAGKEWVGEMKIHPK